MKRLLSVLGLLGLPFVVMALMFLSDLVRGDAYSFLVNVTLVSLPQLVWTLVCLLPIPRSAYVGGLLSADAFLIFAMLWYLIVITQNDPYHEGLAFTIGFFYLPYSLVIIPVGALAGYLIQRIIRAMPAW